MSTFFSFKYPDCIQILTDTAWLDATGKMVADRSKVFTFPGLPMAVTARGNVDTISRTLGELGQFLDSLATFDAAEAAWHFIKRHFKRLGGGGLAEAEFLFAFHSSTEGPQHYYIPMHPHSGFSAFSAHDCGDQMAGGAAIGWDDIAHLNLGAEDLAKPSFPREFGPHILQAMRKPAKIPGQEMAYVGMGGSCELTTISNSGVITVVLASWDDKVGLPLKEGLWFRCEKDGKSHA